MSELTAEIKLTQFTTGSGCGCKIAPAVLDEILKDQAKEIYPQLLVGNEYKDDAAVWEMDDSNCLISTTDFFTPVVDDAFDFGRIAATNALSDVYAMGGTPFMALAILGFPVEKIPVETARQIIAGAKSVCKEATVALAGGHSIDIPEPVFGLAVNGLVSKKSLKRNSTARAGDLLFLTKPLGTGVFATAHKKGKLSSEDLQSAVNVMTKLNREGIIFGKLDYVHALTDVTGFGLLGHLIEMCEGSDLSAELWFPKVHLIPGFDKYSSQFLLADNTYRNWNAYEKKVGGVNGTSFIPLCDPQTSGGLLVAVDPAFETEFRKILTTAGLADFSEPIGVFKSKTAAIVNVMEL